MFKLKLLFFLFLFAYSKSATDNLCSYCGISKVQSRIGGESYQLSTYAPWTVNIEWRDHFLKYCTGVLIDRQHALTAAHCFHDLKNQSPENIAKKLDLISAGSLDRLKNQKFLKAEKVFIHEKYSYVENDINSYNDIAIIKFTEPFTISDKLRPICVGIDGKEGDDVVVQGFGDSVGPQSQKSFLKEGYLVVSSEEKCKTTYKDFYTPEHLCAQNGTTAVLPGDSGGPLIKILKGRNYVIGLSSWGGPGDGFPNEPIVFTRITSYIDWIKLKTNIETCPKK